jgi:anti-sigma factor RsiW
VPDHPDREQLAAFQAGDVDRRERLDVEAHLAGCPSCAEVVASVGRARASLALLEEPDLPPGLHDRLAAAVDAEVATAADTTAAPAAGRRPRRSPEAAQEPRALRPTPWYRRPVAWGAAAALLLAALVVPFLNQSASNHTTAVGDAGGGSRAAQEAATPAPSAAASLPVVRVQGEVTAATVRDRLDTDARAKAALDSAAAGAPQSATDQDQGAFRANAGGSSAGPLELQSCLPAASAAAEPATRPLVPAFFIEGTYRGRDATVLVTTSTPQPSRVDLWVFPRDSCTSPILATERVR